MASFGPNIRGAHSPDECCQISSVQKFWDFYLEALKELLNVDKKLILVINDDGITAKGIKSLVEAVQDLGEVHVVAPDSPQSGMGHAVTIGDILRIKEHNFSVEGIPAHSTSGLRRLRKACYL